MKTHLPPSSHLFSGGYDPQYRPVSGYSSTFGIGYVHESQPFEAYRQLLSAMRRYQASMSILGGCRLIVTPLASKLITLGAGLACFEMHTPNLERNSGVAIAHAEPTRYVVSPHELQASKPELSSLLVTGQAYE